MHLTNYLGAGFYHRALKMIEQVYPKSQVVLVRSKDLAVDPAGSCQRAFEAAGLAPHDVSALVANQAVTLRSRRFGRLLQRDSLLKRLLRAVLPLGARVRARERLTSLNAKPVVHPPLSREQRAALDELYADDLARLREDYGIDLG